MKIVFLPYLPLRRLVSKFNQNGSNYHQWWVVFRLFMLLLGSSQGIRAQQTISAASTTNTSVSSSNTYTAAGATGSSLSSSTYSYRYGTASGATNNKVFLNNFMAGSTTYYFDYGMSINVILNRVNNTVVSGTRDLLYNEGSIGAGQININAPYVPSMTTLFIGNDDLRSGTDNLFGNTGDGSDNNNNIERLDVRLNGNAGYTVSDPAKEGFAVFERGAAGAHDPFTVSIITSLSGGNPSGYTGILRLTSASYGASNPLVDATYVVLRRENGTGNLLASASPTNQGIGGIFFRFADFGIAAGTKVYGYSLAGGDFPAGASAASLVDFTNTTNFPTNTASGAAGGIDLAAITGVFKIANEDLDAVLNSTDVDDDNDGIPDTEENGGVDPYGDADSDGMQNFVDPTPGAGVPAFTDANGDNINDAFDADKDGQINQIDLDSDNDGIPDIVEAGGVDTNGNGFIDGGVADSDGDGLMNAYDASTGGVAIANLDTDGDGIKNFLDLDSDNDGIADIVEAGGVDANGDGRVDNYLDTDSDGFDDTIDGDTGNDGTAENTARALLVTGADGNSDGRPDSYPQGIGNTDGRSLPNAYDLDSDNDGITDVVEAGGVDADNNGRADNYTDTDSDGFADTRDGDVGNDGTAENTANVLIITGADADDNGRPDSYPRANADGAGVPNPYDLDSDNDGIPDLIESGGIDSNGDGRIDGLTDTDNNGWQDSYDPTVAGGINIRLLDANGASTGGGVFDFDGDGIANYLDLDSDNDGIPDIVEQGGTDSDNDGKVDVTTDVDNDGFADNLDPINNATGAAIAGATPLITATTISATTNLPTVYSTGDNSDATGLINMLDLDADGDGILDVREAGLTDTDFNGVADGTLGTDGWSDTVDALGTLTMPNTDGRGGANYLDIDADDDGLTDNVEAQTTAAYLLPSGLDSDADGIDDSYDNNDAGFAGTTNNGLTPNNHDGADNPDHLDTDSDNDGVNDLKEGSGTASATLTNTTDTDGDGLVDQFDTFNLGTQTSNLQNNITIAGMGNSGSTSGPTPAGSNIIANQTNNASPNRDWRNSAFVLPIRLISFAVNKVGTVARINWVAESEINFKEYVIERSTNGAAYTPIAAVSGKGPGRNQYTYNDDLSEVGATKILYRLKQVDLDGQYTYSPIAIVYKDAVNSLQLQLTPNPARGAVTVHVTSTKPTIAVVSVLNNLGHVLFTENYTISAGANSIALAGTTALASGIYVVKLEVNGEIKTERLIIQQ